MAETVESAVVERVRLVVERVTGRCWHKWLAWEAPEQVKIGRKWREEIGDMAILHGERTITVQWRQCARCGDWAHRQIHAALKSRTLTQGEEK